jgi:hypothetical protein
LIQQTKHEMKKTILFIILPYALNAQVGINTTTPTKSLDINGELRIRTLPVGVAADDILSTDTNGNVRKVSRSDLSGGTSSGFNNTILGYDPKPVATRPQPPGSAPGGGTATELGCKNGQKQSHVLCLSDYTTY